MLVIHFPSGKRTTVSYPKYLVEKRNGRYLGKDETIDHIDGDPLNNHEDNLQVLNRTVHATLDVKRRLAEEFICPICSRKFIVEGSKLSKRQRGAAGPFCSRSCSGHYGVSVQRGGDKLPHDARKPSYASNKELQSLHEETHGVEAANSGKP